MTLAAFCLPSALPHALPRLVAACALALLAAAPVAQAAKFVSIDRPEVNMRTGPGTRHEASWTLIRGYPLQVLGRTGRWLKVKDFEGDIGWVSRPLTGATPHHIVRGRVANVRSGPGTQHRIVGQAEYGEVVRTVERRGSWVKVRRTDAPGGWISKKLLWGW